MEENVVITLSDKKKYVIANRILLEEKEYLYLVDINNIQNFMFCELNGNRLTKVQDVNTLNRLISTFHQEDN